MPQPSQLAHRNVSNPALPYKSFVSPTDTEPHFVSGSSDILTTIKGTCGRRPGFSDAVENTPTTFTSLKRLFTYDRAADGTFYIIANDITASSSVVYKLAVGTDNSFVSIYTDSGSTTPFDFVNSNDVLYFSNGHVAKKWTPGQGVTNWGITAPSATPTVGGTGSWWQPGLLIGSQYTSIYDANGNIQAVTTTGTAGSTTPAWSSSTGATTTDGTITWTCGGTPSTWKPSTYYQKFSTVTDNNGNLQMATTVATTSASGSSIPSWSSTLGGTTTDGTITWTCLGTGSSISTTGWQWVYCYYNSTSGHVSSPSTPSYSTGKVLSNQGMSFNVFYTASSDAQVDKIKIFRSTDSVAPGFTAANYFEIPASPVANATSHVTDTTIDANLSITSFSPLTTFNDPPTAIKASVYFSGRVWGFSGNKVYFSALEECINGVPEESFPSGTAGNYWTFDQPVQGLAVVGDNPNQTLIIFCGGRMYGITGNSLDTFRRFNVSNKRGCRAVTTTASMGGMTAWLDSANQIWISDGNSLKEIGIDIRTDIKNVTPSNCSIAFHVAGEFHWLVLSTGSKLFVYDMDNEQWMPPWTFSAKYIYSGETSAGNYVLMASNGTKALKLNASKFNDNGSTYAPVIQTNLFSAVPDFGKRFAYNVGGIYDEPSKTGLPWYFQMDANNGTMFSDVGILTDDDPTNSGSSYRSIFGQKTTTEQAWTRPNGTNLVQNVWAIGNQVCRWISMKVTFLSRDNSDNIFGWFLAYEPRR